jgi:hypothetical protein
VTYLGGAAGERLRGELATVIRDLLKWAATTHVREGWNIGKPPYGYAAKRYRHPNPAKAAKGATKTRLEPDGARGETVTQIAQWRYYEQIGYATIADRLNADLDRYPVPEPPGGVRARGAWGKSTVCDILRNPKYTGYQVFNRRATHSRRGASNDPELWVWSPEPAHEPLIPKWMFDELAARRKARRGSRDGGTKDPRANRTYVLRGMVQCGCGRRMFGNARPTRTYYTCWPADVAEAAERIENTMYALHRLSPREGTAKGVEAVRAPNGIRTRATALKGRRPGPLDDEG